MPENKGFWTSQIGDYVRVDTNKQSYFGKVESTNFDITVLKPSLIDERFESGGDYHMEEQRLTVIDTKAIIGIQPISKEHLDEVCEHYSREKIQERKQEKEKEERRIILP